MSRSSPASRQGLTLIEILVTIAIIGALAIVAVPTLGGMLDVQQRAAARELAQTYIWLVDEAKLRNVSFRLCFNLDRNTWKVEMGDPNTLVYGDPESRKEAEEKIADAMSRYTEREKEEAGVDGGSMDLRGLGGFDFGGGEDEAEQERLEKSQTWEGLDAPMFKTEQTLPYNAVLHYVWTPQYGEEGARASEDGPPDDPEEDALAYTYIFPDGSAEHTVIRIITPGDEEDGWSIEVQPLTGAVSIHGDIVDPTDSLSWLPEEGPDFQ